MPGRRFPEEDAPPPSAFVSPEPPKTETETSLPPPPQSSDRPLLHPPPPSNPASPPYGLPFSLTYANAWDTVPSIQKYAERLVRPPPVQQLAPAFDLEEYRRRRESWDERMEAGSRDGDDEDEGEDEHASPTESNKRWNEDSDDGKSGRPVKTKSRSRRDSDAVSASIGKSKKKYTVRGVQTDPREMRSQGVQVNVIDSSTSKVPNGDRPRRKDSHDQGQVSRGSSHFTRGHGRKSWVPPPVAPSGGQTSMTTVSPNSPPGDHYIPAPPLTPSGMRSPREYSFPEPETPSPGRTTPKTPRLSIAPGQVSQSHRKVSEPPPSLSSSIVFARTDSPTGIQRQSSNDGSSIIQRQSSNDGSSITSPPSSIGPISPDDQYTVPLGMRKPGRVFDPARGVDLFKRGSEEVLARFLRMKSWEDENAATP